MASLDVTYDGKVPPVEFGDFACAEPFSGGDNASVGTAEAAGRRIAQRGQPLHDAGTRLGPGHDPMTRGRGPLPGHDESSREHAGKATP
jgi:hypothetical protein